MNIESRIFTIVSSKTPTKIEMSHYITLNSSLLSRESPNGILVITWGVTICNIFSSPITSFFCSPLRTFWNLSPWFSLNSHTMTLVATVPSQRRAGIVIFISSAGVGNLREYFRQFRGLECDLNSNKSRYINSNTKPSCDVNPLVLVALYY